jgi:hypothetical protein
MNEVEQLREFRQDLPGPRAESRDAARAALMERAEASSRKAPAKRRRLRPRALALAGVGVAATIAILIAIGSTGGAGVSAQRASAADLQALGNVLPRLQIAGPWQIVSLEGSAQAGRVDFRYEEGLPGFEPWPDPPWSVFVAWTSGSEVQRRSELLADGYTYLGRQVLSMSRPTASGPLPFTFQPFPVGGYVAPADSGPHSVVALWQEDGLTFELDAEVKEAGLVWRLAERVEILSEEEWAVALRPGGGAYVAAKAGGVQKMEKVKVGEKPNGEPIYGLKGLIKGPGPGERLEPDLTGPPPPVIYREGDRVRIVVEPSPPEEP